MLLCPGGILSPIISLIIRPVGCAAPCGVQTFDIFSLFSLLQLKSQLLSTGYWAELDVAIFFFRLAIKPTSNRTGKKNVALPRGYFIPYNIAHNPTCWMRSSLRSSNLWHIFAVFTAAAEVTTFIDWLLSRAASTRKRKSSSVYPFRGGSLCYHIIVEGVFYYVCMNYIVTFACPTKARRKSLGCCKYYS